MDVKFVIDLKSMRLSKMCLSLSLNKKNEEKCNKIVLFVFIKITEHRSFTITDNNSQCWRLL